MKRYIELSSLTVLNHIYCQSIAEYTPVILNDSNKGIFTVKVL